VAYQHSQGTVFDKIDFSKPERYIREITDFLNSVTLVSEINLKHRGRSISSSDAQLLIHHLLQLMVPNLHQMPNFNPKEI